MTEHRLSKLQKWILKTAYERESKSIRKQDIYKVYFGHSCYWEKCYEWDKKEGWYKKSNSHRVVVCRSLNLLEGRKLIEIDRWRGKYADVGLTEEGKKKALMLIPCAKKVLTIREKESLNVNISPKESINIKENKQRR